MTETSAERIRAYIGRSRDLLDRAAQDAAFVNSVVQIAESISACFRAGGKVMLAGNGGSAADAQHIAAEFLSRFLVNRAPLPAIALTTDTSALTAIGNDFGFDQVFSRQVRGLGKAGDVLIAISTSGRSGNVLSAIAAAREMGVTVVGFGGSGGDMRTQCDLYLAVPSAETAPVQQLHITAAHIICELVESDLFPVNTAGNP